MLKSVSLLLAALALANGGTMGSQRSGQFNRYYLYTSSQTGLLIDSTTLSTDIDRDLTTVVIVHGHGASYLTSLNPDLVRILLASGDLNVIVVDWSVFAGMSYTLAESAVPTIGLHLANFLAFQNIPVATTHLVGFNLGAHVVGFAGRLRPGIARITGLDPSSSANRLARTDANYVEVIHTDSTGLLSNGLGVQMGHADFYPNGGGNQPGCWGNNQCNHNRAWLLFAASIREQTFSANCCNTLQQKNRNLCGGGATIPMGMNTLANKMPCASGIYRVNTGSSYPF